MKLFKKIIKTKSMDLKIMKDQHDTGVRNELSREKGAKIFELM